MPPLSGSGSVYERLRQAIVDGDLPAGSVLAEQELAARYGVSRTPVREALTALVHEGLAVKRVATRTTVAPLSIREIRQVHDVRERLEGLIARDAASGASERDHAELRRLVELMERLDGQDREVARLGEQFHAAVAVASGNAIARAMLRTVRAHVDRYRVLSTRRPGRASETVREHRDICEALVSRDAELAERLMREHVRRAKEVALQQIGDVEHVE